MATGGEAPDDILDDLLKCSICLETFKDPRYLPCLHTFCSSCIETYLSSFKEKNEELKCPLCRKSLSSFVSLQDSDKIADGFPENLFILSLMNKHEIRSSEKQCDSCKSSKVNKTAVSWCFVCSEAYCSECERCHKTFKMSSQHEIVALSEIKDKENETIMSENIICQEHPNKLIEVYCVDHDAPCCTLCATLSHRKCDRVVSIDEAAAEIKEGKEVSNLKKSIDDHEKCLAEIISNKKDNETKIETEAANISDEISKTRATIDEHLNKIENLFRGELGGAKKQIILQLTDDINDIESLHSEIINWKSLLECVLKHGSDKQTLVMLKKITPLFCRLKAEMKERLEKIQNVSLNFSISDNLSEFSNSAPIFGEIKKCLSRLENQRARQLFKNEGEEQVHVLKTISVIQSGEFSGIFPETCMLFVSVTTPKIFKYDLDGALLKEADLDVTPTDLALVNGTTVAIQSKQLITFFDSDRMEVLKTVKIIPENTSGFGICTLNDKQFILGSQNMLTWIEKDTGTKIKSETTSGNSYFVSSFGNNDYIYGDGNSTVCYVVDDNKKFTYKSQHLSAPRGIGMGHNGNFFIAGMNSKNIHQVTNDGELVRIIPTSKLNIENPCVIRFARNGDRFLVTSYSGKASICEFR